MKYAIATLLMIALLGCKKEEVKTTSRDILMTGDCDSCMLTYWEGKRVVSTIQMGHFEHNYQANQGDLVAIGIKYDTSYKPATVSILLNGIQVANETEKALLYGESDVGKNWPWVSYEIK